MKLGSPLLSAIPGLRHAFFTRDGGVSDGIYESLNGGLGSNDDPAKVAAHVNANPPHAQPVVRLHPVNGRPCLFVNSNYTGPIVGMESTAGDALRDYLVDQFKKPDYQMRVKWRPNTIVVWDNCQVQHYAVYDYNEPRTMERILVAGDQATIGYDAVEKLTTTA